MEQSRLRKEGKLKKRMERKKRARALGISEEELAKQEGENDDVEEDEKSIKTLDMLKDLQVTNNFLIRILFDTFSRGLLIDKFLLE